MMTGTVASFDAESGDGYIIPDGEDEKLPFDAEVVEDYDPGDPIRVGEKVLYEVEGGMAGIMAKVVHRTAGHE